MDTYVKDADAIWLDFKTRIKNDNLFNSLSPDKMLEFYQKNNHQFTMSFPIVLRYMIQLKQYNRQAFIKFIKKITAHPYKSELEFCERQSDYVKYLYMETTPRYTMSDANAVWKRAYDLLSSEVTAFKEAEKHVKDKMEKSNTQNSNERRRELKNMLGMD
jgi:hypothetical protein